MQPTIVEVTVNTTDDNSFVYYFKYTNNERLHKAIRLIPNFSEVVNTEVVNFPAYDTDSEWFDIPYIRLFGHLLFDLLRTNIPVPDGVYGLKSKLTLSWGNTELYTDGKVFIAKLKDGTSITFLSKLPMQLLKELK